MRKLKIVGKIFYWLILSVLVLVAGFIILTTFNLPGNYKIMTVLSGSMEPLTKTGSIMIVKPEKEYKLGDIVSFRNSESKTPTTHRIAQVRKYDKQLAYRTKGDANDSLDVGELSQGMILGKKIISIPFLGYIASFIRSKEGFLVFILIPSGLIVLNEAMNIKKETINIIKKRRYE